MIRKLHRLTGIILAAFIAIHLISHLAALLGPEAHLAALRAVRPIYRSAPVEPLLLASLLGQLALGMMLLRQRRRIGIEPGWGTAQIASGLYVALFITIHATSALYARYVNHLDTNFWWPASTLAHPGLRYFFYPYYFIGVIAVFVHLAAALHYRAASTALVKGLLIAGPVMGLLLLSAFGGWTHKVAIPPAYSNALEANLGLKSNAP